MATFYLVLVILLFILAISDLIVGVSNDAVNFLNSAVGSKAASMKTIMIVAALGILVGATFSSGMMEVARKGIFNPQFFYFSEIIILFLAVMVTDVILLDTFNTYGMPTSTTVSIVFELLGAAVAISMIKVLTDPDALHLYEYINSAKALAIISGILLSVVIAFTCGVIIQYLSRLLFSFDYDKRIKYFGSVWGGLAVAALTYFLLIKGSKGASFMTSEIKGMIVENTWMILGISFLAWTIILQVVSFFIKIDILKIVVLIGTFSLAMAFAGNDLVNFIGVPLAGYNSYNIFIESGGASADTLLMDGLAGKVPTPTLLLLFAGLIMVITLVTSKKARSVVQTSLDLGRQGEGFERFGSFVLSRRLVRSFAKFATTVNNNMPGNVRKNIEKQFDQKPFERKQMHLGTEAPSFDLVRAAVTLVVASILITIGTNLKLPLSTTYVTFMVFMGTSLADGAWGRESAVYRVSGVLSVIGGWFFTAFSAFLIAFILALIFYFGGIVAIIIMSCVAAYLIFKTHKLHNQKMEEQQAFETSLEEGALSKVKVVELSVQIISETIDKLNEAMDHSFEGLKSEDLGLLNLARNNHAKIESKLLNIKSRVNKVLDRIPEQDIEAGHMYILVIDYLKEMAYQTGLIIKSNLNHVDNNHKSLLPAQFDELRSAHESLKQRYSAIIDIFRDLDLEKALNFNSSLSDYMKTIRSYRKNQIKRIKGHEVGTRNSVLYLHILGEMRNLALFSNRLVRVFDDFVLNPNKDEAQVDLTNDAIESLPE